MITATRRQDQRIALLSRSILPFIALGRSESQGDFPWIDLDFEGAAARSVAELVAHGHSRIAVALPDSDAMLGYNYRRGFMEAMALAGLPVDQSLIFRVPTSEAGGYELGKCIVMASHRPSAVILCCEATTVGLYACLQQHGLVPGADLSIITFRENPQMRFLVPAPACFRVNLVQIGRLLAERVLARLQESSDAGAGTSPENSVVPMEFLPGPSVVMLR